MEYQNHCIIYSHQEQAELVAAPIRDDDLAPHEIFGRALYTLVSNGSEKGGSGAYRPKGADFLPTSTGYTSVLEILKIGEAVTAVRPGDIVFAESPHEAYSRVTDDTVIPIPAGLAPDRAIFCRFPAVSMTSILKTHIRPTEKALVTGQGIVGLFCAQVLRKFGYDVYTIDPADRRREVSRTCGILHTAASPEELEELKGQFGVAFECSGMEEAAFTCASLLRHGGELFQVGVPWYKSTDRSAHSLLRDIFYGFITLHGGWEWSLPRHPEEFSPDSHETSLRRAMEWIADGSLVVDGIYQAADPADAGEIYHKIVNKTIETTAVLFDWRKYSDPPQRI